LTETAYDKYLKLCTENDVKGVFDYKREQLRNDESLSESEKNIQLASLDIMEDLYREDMSYDAWHEITESFSLRDMYKASLEKGTNSAGQKLTQSEIEEYSLAVAEIEQGMRVGAPGYGGKYTTNDKTTGTVLIQIGTGLGQILVIMLGALIVAEDFQSGAIKTLIIAPVKRRRIVSAKFALLASVCLICALQVFVTYMIAALISGSDLGYNVFVIGHSVIALNPFLYYLFYILVSFVPVFFHGCFAFMLSTLIRNAGGSIAVSMGTVFMISGNAAVPMILSMMGSQAYFLKHISVFLPASNLSLAESLFKSAVQNRSIGLMDVLTMNIFGQTGNGPLFSFLYLMVLSAVFIFISYQSYVKRDVK
ncbi:MAG: ABC transporter permease, partial [Clostridia bacterium]|nr:ABC transporter permease [Clostridia bacterium]